MASTASRSRRAYGLASVVLVIATGCGPEAAPPAPPQPTPGERTPEPTALEPSPEPTALEPTPAPTLPDPTPSSPPGPAAYFLTDLLVTLRSRDVGATWKEVLPFAPRSLSFIDARAGWAAGDELLLETMDGGDTWTSRIDRLPTAGAVLGPIDFADRRTGIVAASAADGSGGGTPTLSLLATSDGGETWTVGFRREGCAGQPVLCLTDGGHALAVACNEPIRSSDGGTTWAPVTSLPPEARFPWRPSCSGDARFWVLGADGRVWRSLDAGLTWSEQPVPPGTTGFSFPSTQTGWAVATSGFSTAVFRTTDGGATWERQLTTPPLEIEPSPPPAVYFADERHGVVAEVRYTAFFQGWIGQPRRWLTADGGASWQPFDAATGTHDVQSSDAYLGAIGLP